MWNWQSEGMVPAFPAVYGGAVQMFGRAYGGGPSEEQALRTKAGQQLVFGEQLGWIEPGMVDRPGAAFFRTAVRTRWRLRRYFASGQMARPPRLEGTNPAVRSDWQWYGEHPVTTEAVLAGAWRLPTARRLALIFVNVSDRSVDLTYRLRPETYGLRAGQVERTTITNDVASAEQPLTLPAVERMHFAPRQVVVWELRW